MRRPHRSFLVALSLLIPVMLSAQEEEVARTAPSVTISGLVLLNGFYTDNTVNNVDAPLFVTPANPATALSAEAVGGTLRQSQIRLLGEASNVLGGAFTGELELDFHGGQVSEGRLNALVRIRRAIGRIRWRHAWLQFGQDVLPISAVNPSTLSSVAIPGFTHSGNLSLWMPQLRFGVETGGSLRLGVELAAVAPRFDEFLGAFETQPDPAERSKRPFLEGRAVARWGDGASAAEFGIGGHYGWISSDSDSLIASRAAAASAQVFFGHLVELRLEAFVGEGIGMLSGALDQTLGPPGRTVRTRGGWVQLLLHPSLDWELGGGYGLDNPDDIDIDPVEGIAKNTTWETHVHWRPAPLLLGLEYRRIETTYANAAIDLLTANHLSMAMGFVF